MFPVNNVWNTDISALPVDFHSVAWLASSDASATNLHPDFGGPYGIPFVTVDNSHSTSQPTFDYAGESDPGPYPFGADTPIEGGSDAHALMWNAQSCSLYELYAASWNGGAPTAGSGAIWNLQSNALRPDGWTSADAAGLPILPGLLRWDEVNAGAVNHAIRFTVQTTQKAHIWPARHDAGSTTDPNVPPMGARFRLKASFDLSRFSGQTQVVLRAMQHYGLILADNGSNWYFTGATDSRWSDSFLSQLKSIPAGQFEAIDESSLMADPNSGAVR